jgi:hypothetical protein
MLILRGFSLFVGYCALAALLWVVPFSAEAGAESCKLSIAGTRQNNEASCIVPPIDMIKEASKRIAETIDEGTSPDDKEVEALNTLLKLVQRRLSRDTSLENRLVAQTDALREAFALYPRDLLSDAGRKKVDDKLKLFVPALFGWAAGSQTGSYTEHAKVLDAALKEAAAKSAFRSGVPQEFVTLNETVLNLGDVNATSTLIAASNTLSTFVENQKASIDMESDALIKSLFDKQAGLITRLQAREAEGGRPARTVLRRAEALKTELTKAIDKPTATADEKQAALVIRQALSRTDITNELVAVRKQTEELTGGLDPKIHIIAAWYGQIGRPWSEGSQCSATHIMRDLCERQESCSASGSNNGAGGGGALDPIKLCGGDPAPDARGLARGLTVDYSCEAGDYEFWADLARNPLNRPGGEPYTRGNTNRTVLRSAAMKINCEFPPR